MENRSFAVIVAIYAIGLLFNGPCYAQMAGEKAVAVKTGDAFQVEVEGSEMQLRLISAGADGKILVIEYPDLLSAGQPSDSGPCTAATGKRYRTIVYEGFCFVTNTCDSGVNLCFKKFSTDGKSFNFNYYIKSDTSGMLGSAGRLECDPLT